MKIISTSYFNTAEFNDPEKWLSRISFYTGILEELARDHHVVSIEQINYRGKLERKGVTYLFLNFNKLKRWFPAALHRIIKHQKPDVVFVNGFIFPFQVIQLRLKLGKKVKIIILHRAEKPFRGIKGYFQKLADKSVDAYLFASAEFGEQWMQWGIIKKREKIHEVMQSSSSFYPEDKRMAREKLGITGKPVFLWVGRLDENKDPLTVIKAFHRYLLFQPSAKLFMIYQDEKLVDEIKKLIADSKVKDAIILVGKVEHQQLQSWYNASDFFISGSHYEGSGISACEAMSCGCIPVLTNIISFRSMTGHGKCGMLYEPGNENKLLEVLLKTKELDYTREREKAIRQFKEELSFEAIAKKINTLFGLLR
jgi:glycosyltransferase involved in cell wall biosynthesis